MTLPSLIEAAFSPLADLSLPVLSMPKPYPGAKCDNSETGQATGARNMSQVISEQHTSTTQESQSRWKGWIELLPGLLAFMYVGGYIVANSHFARVEFTKPDLLSGRYLSAGVQFLVISVIPAAPSLRLWHN